ncbi:MAG: hypothetical protein GC180_09090 [Bacteroidetes bacterium]|nr:hypothetical protein [Bacteroidota bacterium]
MAKVKNTEDYIEQAAAFAQPVLRHLQFLVHATIPAVEEQIKWNFPCFIYKGKILCHMAAFKGHCAFGFWLAPLMNDPSEILEKRDEGSAMGQLGKISSFQDLPDDAILKAYLLEAASLIDEGKTLPKKEAVPKKDIDMHPAFRKALEKHPLAMEAFQNMSASHQREYLLYIDEAKKEETKIRRIEKSIALLLDGLDLNSSYRK